MSSRLGVGNAVVLSWVRCGRQEFRGQRALGSGVGSTAFRRGSANNAKGSARNFLEVGLKTIRSGHAPLHRKTIMTPPASLREDPSQAPVKLLTLVIIEQEGRLLLGMKKRGFGEGYYNGFGGKVEAGETVEEAAARELQEEAGVAAVNMVKRGVLTFHFDDKPMPWEVHVFHVHEFVGEPCETEEMSPIWFSIADIPYDKMWKDDVIWYPPFLEGLSFRGDFFFKNTHELVSHSLQIVPVL